MSLIPAEDYLTLVMSSTQTLNEIIESKQKALDNDQVPIDQIDSEANYIEGITEIVNERLLTSLVMSESTTLD